MSSRGEGEGDEGDVFAVVEGGFCVLRVCHP